MINLDHLVKYVIKPALIQLNIDSSAREQLIIGTCAQESQLGTYLKQVGNGPAKGIFQMEDATYKDNIKNYINNKAKLKQNIFTICGFVEWPTSDELITNLKLAAIMCAIKYMRVQEELPGFNDIDGQARYWKQHYNTPKGAGTVQEYIKNYDSYVGKYYS